MRKLTITCLSGILLALASAAFAYPTLFGPTGGAVLPTAEIAPASRLDVAADWYDAEFNSVVPVRATWGDRNWEIGALYSFNTGSDNEDIFGNEFDTSSNIWGVNGKIGMPMGERQALALGAIYTATTSSDLNFNSTYVYLAYTYKFNQACPENGMSVEPGGLRGTIGVNWTDVSTDEFSFCDPTIGEFVTVGGDDNAFRAYVNADYTFDNFLTIGAEIQSESSDFDDDPLWAAYARYPFSDMIAAQVGVTNTAAEGLFGTSNANFFAGVNFSFGPGAVRANRKGECECPTQTEQCPPGQTQQGY